MKLVACNIKVSH